MQKQRYVGKQFAPELPDEESSVKLSCIDEMDEINRSYNESDLSHDLKQDKELAKYNKPLMKTFDCGVQISFGNRSSDEDAESWKGKEEIIFEPE